MRTKMGRGRVHGIRIAAQRQGSSLPNTLQSIKDNVCQERMFEAETWWKDLEQRCYWHVGQTRTTADLLNEWGGYFLSEAYNSSLEWWIFVFASLNLRWSWEFFPCLCRILLSTSFTLAANSHFYICLNPATHSVAKQMSKTVRSNKNWTNKEKNPHTETENSSVIWVIESYRQDRLLLA